MSKNINETEFTIFDTETTGLDPDSGDRIVELGAIRFKAGKIRETFHSLINPGKRQISPAAFAVNQITESMLKGAPLASAVLPKFLCFSSGSCLAAYNAPFDFGFLNSEARLINQKIPEELQVIDILIMARKLLPGLPRYPLWCVGEHLGIDFRQEHRALADVRLTLEVFIRLISKCSQKRIIDYEQFISLFGLNSQQLNNINSLKIARIQEALDLGAGLKIKYFSGRSAELTERQVTPRKITQDKGRAYLLGFCHLRSQERSFKISNILHLEIARSE